MISANPSLPKPDAHIYIYIQSPRFMLGGPSEKKYFFSGSPPPL